MNATLNVAFPCGALIASTQNSMEFLIHDVNNDVNETSFISELGVASAGEIMGSPMSLTLNPHNTQDEEDAASLSESNIMQLSVKGFT